MRLFIAFLVLSSFSLSVPLPAQSTEAGATAAQVAKANALRLNVHRRYQALVISQQPIGDLDRQIQVLQVKLGALLAAEPALSKAFAKARQAPLAPAAQQELAKALAAHPEAVEIMSAIERLQRELLPLLLKDAQYARLSAELDQMEAGVP